MYRKSLLHKAFNVSTLLYDMLGSIDGQSRNRIDAAMILIGQTDDLKLERRFVLTIYVYALLRFQILLPQQVQHQSCFVSVCECLRPASEM